MAITELYVRSDAGGTGNGTTDANSGANGAFTWAQMLADATAGPVRYNLKNGTYSRTSSADSFTTAGTMTTPRFLRGFNATIGDLAANGRTLGGALVTTNFPETTYSTGGILTPSYFGVEHVKITAARTAGALIVGPYGIIHRVSVLNNHANSATAKGIDTLTNYGSVFDCDATCTSSSSSSIALATDRGQALHCLCICGSGIAVQIGAVALALSCMIRDSTTGVNFLPGALGAIVSRCSFRNVSGNCINNLATVCGTSIHNNVAWGSGGSSKWYNSTTTVRNFHQRFNAIGNMGAGDSNEGDWPVTDEIMLTADPFTSATDLTLNNTAGGGAACRAAGFFAYSDLGALQHQDSGGGSARPSHPLFQQVIA